MLQSALPMTFRRELEPIAHARWAHTPPLAAARPPATAVGPRPPATAGPLASVPATTTTSSARLRPKTQETCSLILEEKRDPLVQGVGRVPVLGAQFRLGRQANMCEKPMVKHTTLLACPGCTALTSKLSRMKADAREEAATMHQQHESVVAAAERAALCVPCQSRISCGLPNQLGFNWSALAAVRSRPCDPP